MRKKNLVVAIDAMGADSGPEMVVAGANLVKKHNSAISFIFCGDRRKIAPLIARYEALSSGVSIEHTDKSISAEQKPRDAVRKGRDSSMALAIQLVGDRRAHCAVSAGNTGALMSLSTFILRPLEGVRRPAICGLLPTRKGYCCMLDLGANLQADVKNLTQFAIMGGVFYRIVKREENPVVALLNVGVEHIKGREEIKEAGKILSKATIVNYGGFVEGHDITKGDVHVIVTDGFTGNVVLKTLEGVSRSLTHVSKRILLRSVFGIAALCIGMPAFLRLKTILNPSKYNGAVMLGLNGIVIKSHGGTDPKGFAMASKVGISLAGQDFTRHLKNNLRKDDFQGATEEIGN